jgi:hypothetical protein
MNLHQNSVINELVPSEFYLGQNYPNPFKEKTIIKYCLAYKTKVIISVYNSKGELMEKLIDEEKKAGTYEIEFNAGIQLSGENRNLEGGVYYYKINAGTYTAKKKMLLLK